MICEKISKCRICGNKNLDFVLNLGQLALTGIFPKDINNSVPKAPLQLVKCNEDNQYSCGLLQLNHSFDMGQLYGDNYGYRSGLNQSMVNHLYSRVEQIEKIVKLEDGDVIIDIGSNDSTLLRSYKNRKLNFVGIDPTGKKFKKYYPDDVTLIPDFFSSDLIKSKIQDCKVKIVTSIAMFYDLENPVSFMQEIYNILDDNGIWVFEQSYMPTMLEMVAYDTICHEHLEYYGLKQIKWMTDVVGFKIIDVELNDVNGGSFCVTVAKKSSKISPSDKPDLLIKKELELNLNCLTPYNNFQKELEKHKEKLLHFISQEQAKGKIIFGCGASTKGNVILQYCGLTPKEIPFVSEVNEDKFGSFTPGTNIPIISEKQARDKNPDYFLVLPWHFKDSIYKREKEFLSKGGKLIFPLPDIEILSMENK